MVVHEWEDRMKSRISNTSAAWWSLCAAVAAMLIGGIVIKVVQMDKDVALWFAGSVFAIVLSLLDFVKQVALKQMTKD